MNAHQVFMDEIEKISAGGVSQGSFKFRTAKRGPGTPLRLFKSKKPGFFWNLVKKILRHSRARVGV